MVDTNSNLRRKQFENPQKLLGFFKKLDRIDEKISIKITKMYITFTNLNSTNVCSQSCHSEMNVNDKLNEAFREHEVKKRMKRAVTKAQPARRSLYKVCRSHETAQDPCSFTIMQK